MNRAERRRRGERGQAFDPDADYCTTAGWCSGKDTLEEAKKATHDTLIRLMGDSRRGGVRWSISEGEKAEKALGELRKGATGGHADYYRQIGGHLREYGGMLVIAMAKGVRPS